MTKAVILRACLVLAVMTGCTSNASSPAGEPASPPSSLRATPTPIAFVSQRYGYSVSLPAGWSAIQATQTWNGKGAPGDEDPFVDTFYGPTGPTSLVAWAYAAASHDNLSRYVRSTEHEAAAKHDCPAVPETDVAIEIGGAPARLLGMHCPPNGDTQVLVAVTVHGGMASIFASQYPTGGDAADRAAFLGLLAGVRFAH